MEVRIEYLHVCCLLIHICTRVASHSYLLPPCILPFSPSFHTSILLCFLFHPHTYPFPHPLSFFSSTLPFYLSPPSPLSASSLFFTNTVPSTINIGSGITTVCPILNIPQATVRAESPPGMNNITYCNVTSERGSFRSRSVTIVDPTQQGLFTLNYLYWRHCA